MTELVLHDYWRSGAAYRTRVGLHLKGVPFRQVMVNLLEGEQRQPGYLELNPQGLVPRLQAGDLVLTQSVAILEWLEETYPEPALMPADPAGRGIVRSLTNIVVADIYPLTNLRVLQALRAGHGATEDAIAAWVGRWMLDGLGAIERLIAAHGRGFAYGEAPTLADCSIPPLAYGCARWGVDLSAFPATAAVAERLSQMPAVQAAHPDRQPGAPA